MLTQTDLEQSLLTDVVWLQHGDGRMLKNWDQIYLLLTFSMGVSSDCMRKQLIWHYRNLWGKVCVCVFGVGLRPSKQRTSAGDEKLYFNKDEVKEKSNKKN